MVSARTGTGRTWRLAVALSVALAAPACNCGAYDATLDRIEAIVASDAGGGVDAGEVDAGPVDAGGVDAGEADAGHADGGAVDAGAPDGGVVADAGRVDAGTPPDAGAPDAGRADGGTFDAGAFDGGPLDGGLIGLDAGVVEEDGGLPGCGKLLQPCPCCSGFFCCVSASGAETCLNLMDVCLP